MRINYGQTTDQNLLHFSLLPYGGLELIDGGLWCMVGGNWQIAKKVLEASGATPHENDVITVTRVNRVPCRL